VVIRVPCNLYRGLLILKNVSPPHQDWANPES
jgi:hypothetical protein